MSEKICPLMTKPVTVAAGFGSMGELEEVYCRESGCELWIDHVYSSPEVHRMEGRCALRFLAEKNAEGKLPI